jgi:hypothetical protein
MGTIWVCFYLPNNLLQTVHNFIHHRIRQPWTAQMIFDLINDFAVAVQNLKVGSPFAEYPFFDNPPHCHFLACCHRNILLLPTSAFTHQYLLLDSAILRYWSYMINWMALIWWPKKQQGGSASAILPTVVVPFYMFSSETLEPSSMPPFRVASS